MNATTRSILIVFAIAGCGETDPAEVESWQSDLSSPDVSMTVTPTEQTVARGDTAVFHISTSSPTGATGELGISDGTASATMCVVAGPTPFALGGGSWVSYTPLASAGGAYPEFVALFDPWTGEHVAYQDLSLTVTTAQPQKLACGRFDYCAACGWTFAGTSVRGFATGRDGAAGGALMLGKNGSNPPQAGTEAAAQTFWVLSGQTVLSFWYQPVCLGNGNSFSATLQDVANGKTVTLLPPSCSATSGWINVTANVKTFAGRPVRLTFSNVNGNNTHNKMSYTAIDDVTVD